MGTHAITIQVTDELAGRLRPRAADLSHILELGLREAESQSQLEFDGAADVLEFLAALPDPADVLALRPSPPLQTRIDALLEKNRGEGLTPHEAEEWRQIEHLEHLVRMAKARAHQKLAD